VTDNASNMKKCFNLMTIVDDTTGFNDLGDLVPDLNSADDVEPNNVTEEDMFEVEEDVDGNLDEFLDLHLEESEMIGHLGCISHTLQLGINSAIKEDAEAKTFINYINEVMLFFKKSTLYSDELRMLTEVDVIIPGKTRWNATLDMIARFEKVGNGPLNNNRNDQQSKLLVVFYIDYHSVVVKF